MSDNTTRQDFDLSSSDPFTIPTRQTDDEVPPGVSKYEIISFVVANEAGAAQTFTIEERDNDANSTLRTFTTRADTDETLTHGLDDDRAIFEVNHPHQVRITGGGASSGTIEYREVK